MQINFKFNKAQLACKMSAAYNVMPSWLTGCLSQAVSVVKLLGNKISYTTKLRDHNLFVYVFPSLCCIHMFMNVRMTRPGFYIL